MKRILLLLLIFSTGCLNAPFDSPTSTTSIPTTTTLTQSSTSTSTSTTSSSTSSTSSTSTISTTSSPSTSSSTFEDDDETTTTTTTLAEVTDEVLVAINSSSFYESEGYSFKVDDLHFENEECTGARMQIFFSNQSAFRLIGVNESVSKNDSLITLINCSEQDSFKRALFQVD